MANKLSVVVSSLKKKKYDALDARKDFYDNDFDEFKRAIEDLHVSCLLRKRWIVHILNLLVIGTYICVIF